MVCTISRGHFGAELAAVQSSFLGGGGDHESFHQSFISFDLKKNNSRKFVKEVRFLRLLMCAGCLGGRELHAYKVSVWQYQNEKKTKREKNDIFRSQI